MKKLFLLLISVVATVSQISGMSPAYEPFQKENYPAEKEKRIIDAAKKVCDEIAPAYNVGILVPVVYTSKVVSDNAEYVMFMKDINDYYTQKIMHVPNMSVKQFEEARKKGRTPRAVERVDSIPHSVILVILKKGTLEPLMVQDEHRQCATFGENGYAEFRKQNPNYRLEPK